MLIEARRHTILNDLSRLSILLWQAKGRRKADYLPEHIMTRAGSVALNRARSKIAVRPQLY